MKSNLPELVHAPWRSHRAKRKNVHWCNARSEKFQQQNRRWCRCALLTVRAMLMSGGTAFCCFHFLGSFKAARLLISSCCFRSSSSPSCKPVCCSIDMKTQILIFWASQYESKSVCFLVMSSSLSFRQVCNSYSVFHWMEIQILAELYNPRTESDPRRCSSVAQTSKRRYSKPVKNPKTSKKPGNYHSSYCLFLLLLLHQAERTRSLAATQDYIRMQKLKNQASLGSSHAIRVWERGLL